MDDAPRSKHFNDKSFNSETGRAAAKKNTDYKPEMAEQAKKLCLLGAIDREIADFFEVNVTTVHRWKLRHPEFAEAIRVGKEHADERVEAALYHRAIGYSHDAVKIFMPAGAVEPVYAPFVEHTPPDTAAAKLWLMNRKGWSDRSKVEVTGKDGAAIKAEVTVEAVLKALPGIQDEC